ncbi:MAG: hypothetical protein RBU21_23850, partial [FCB group bacterium]|nr:hypothetical protein [FCB group bacterium]
MNRRRWRWAALAGLSIAWGAWAQEPPDPPPAPAEIEALREQVRSLTHQINGLEARYAADQANAEESTQAAAEEKAKAPKVTLDSGGLRVRSADDAFEHRIRLRVSHDFAWFNQDKELEDFIGDEQDGTGFRMARLRLQGKVWNDFSYLAEFDFAGQTPEDSPV